MSARTTWRSRTRAARSPRLCGDRRRVCDLVEGQPRAAGRPRWIAHDRGGRAGARPRAADLRHRRYRSRQRQRRDRGGRRRGRGDLGTVHGGRSDNRRARPAQNRRPGAGQAGRRMTTPIAVTIAGSDSSGGAGIQADLKTFSALGVYGASVITALTAQNTQGVTAIHDVPPDFITAQIDAVFADLTVNAVKIGMLSAPAAIEAVAAGLARWSQSLVVLDPVMVATSGDRLLAPA